MSFFEFTEPNDISANGVFSKVKQSLGNAMRAMQYARMRQAMSELTDTQLEAIGLTRADIPRFAREIVYDFHT